MNPDNDNERPVASSADDVESNPAANEPALQGSERGPRGVADVQAYIGRQLRAVYDDVVKQPIPDRFLALMQQLEGQAPKP